jgi:hypothetical protein
MFNDPMTNEIPITQCPNCNLEFETFIRHWDLDIGI